MLCTIFTPLLAAACFLKELWFLNGARNTRMLIRSNNSLFTIWHQKRLRISRESFLWSTNYEIIVNEATSAVNLKTETESKLLTLAEFYERLNVPGEKLWTKERGNSNKMYLLCIESEASVERGWNSIRESFHLGQLLWLWVTIETSSPTNEQHFVIETFIASSAGLTFKC